MVTFRKNVSASPMIAFVLSSESSSGGARFADPFHHLFVIPFIGSSLRYCLTTSLSSEALFVTIWFVLLVKLPGTMIHVSITPASQLAALYLGQRDSVAAFATK